MLQHRGLHLPQRWLLDLNLQLYSAKWKACSTLCIDAGALWDCLLSSRLPRLVMRGVSQAADSFLLLQCGWCTHHQKPTLLSDGSCVCQDMLELEVRFHWLSAIHLTKMHEVSSKAEREAPGASKACPGPFDQQITSCALPTNSAQWLRLQQLCNNLRGNLKEIWGLTPFDNFLPSKRQLWSAHQP